MSRSGQVFPPVHPTSAAAIEERPSRLPEPPPLPDKLTPKALRDAIVGVLAGVSADYLEEECMNFGLPGQAENEDGPWQSKLSRTSAAQKPTSS